MKEHDANEQRYRNGYAAGYEAGKRDAVKHGRWEHYWRGCYFNVKCTACGVDAISVNTTLPVSLPTVMWEYCPNCGAGMRGDQK